ncbi:unnamed protein product, partial [marine sediment metagenome]
LDITLSENEKIAEKKGVIKFGSIFSKSFVIFLLYKQAPALFKIKSQCIFILNYIEL